MSHNDIIMKPKSDFTRKELLELADRYSYNKPDPVIKGKYKGYLTREEFSEIVEWKTKRQINNYNKNSDDDILKTTTLAFAPNTSERLRIESLCLLHGVHYPVASSILHFGYRPDYYPIIDVRAIDSLYGIEVKNYSFYTFAKWKQYCSNCRELSLKVSSNTLLPDTPMRIVDKALWQFSKNKDNDKKKSITAVYHH